MKAYGKVTKTELTLLGITALFLCVLLGLHLQDQRQSAGAVVVTTEKTAPPEAVEVDVSPLDLNTATEEALQTLPGVGEELARRIVQYREVNGPFADKEAIMEVSGIGAAKFEAMEDWITVEIRESAE